MPHYFLSLGSNVEPEKHLRAALRELRARFGELRASSVYESAAVGFEGSPFWNLAVALQTDLDGDALNEWLHRLEDAQGRKRNTPRYSNRTLDIDIVAVDGHTLERPELREAFVLAPLNEIAPELIETRSGETIAALWAKLKTAQPDQLPRRLDIDLLAP